MYQLATYENKMGVISPTLVERGAALIHGNELLASFVRGYGTTNASTYRRRDHTLNRVLSYFRASADFVGAPYGSRSDKNIQTAFDYFVGYLMFDAWIANQDRHDQNWALLRANNGNLFLAPSFDHGSSMGRNEPDTKRVLMLETKDMGRHISMYAQKARSALYPTVNLEEGVKALGTLDAFQRAARFAPLAAADWQSRLSRVTNEKVREIIACIPQDWMSDVARRFTYELLMINRDRILNSQVTK